MAKYVSGGRTNDYNYRPPSASLYVYDPWQDTWTRKSSMPNGGTDGVSGFINGTLYVLTTCEQPAGEETYYEPCPQSSFCSYNRLTDRWSILPRPSGAYRVGGVMGGKFYAVGERLEMYDPFMNQWREKASPPTPPAVGAAGAVLKGRLYVLGGRKVSDGEWKTYRTVNGLPRLELVGGSLPGNNLQYIP